MLPWPTRIAPNSSCVALQLGCKYSMTKSRFHFKHVRNICNKRVLFTLVAQCERWNHNSRLMVPIGRWLLCRLFSCFLKAQKRFPTIKKWKMSQVSDNLILFSKRLKCIYMMDGVCHRVLFTSMCTRICTRLLNHKELNGEEREKIRSFDCAIR